jgi:cytochrome c6
MRFLLNHSTESFGGIFLALTFATTVILQGLSQARPPADSTKDVYLHKCVVCHGEDGAGKTAKGKKVKAKDLGSREVQKMSDAELFGAIAKGKGLNMDGYEKELTKEQIEDLVAYTREFAKKK